MFDAGGCLVHGFRLAIDGELFGPEGQPLFGMAALDTLTSSGEIQVDILGAEHGFTRTDAAAFDAVYLNALKIEPCALDGADLRLKLIARHGAGYDALDIAELTRRGVLVTNTPEAVRRPVAAMVITFALALGQKLLVKDRLTRSGRWHDRTLHMGVGLTGKTMGIIGAGGIGWETARLAQAFDMRILMARSARNAGTESRHGAVFAPLDEVIGQADFLALTCRLSPETTHLIDAGRLALMKPTAYLINVARGPVVDEAALIDALRHGQLAGAGLDVFETEPVAPDNPLLAMDNVVLAPHALGWTDESFSAIGETAIRGIMALAAHTLPQHIVNPEALRHPRLIAWTGMASG